MTRNRRGVAGMVLMTAVVAAAGTGTARAELPGDVPDKVRIAIGGMECRFEPCLRHQS